MQSYIFLIVYFNSLAFTRGMKLVSNLKEKSEETRSLFNLKTFEQPDIQSQSRRIDDCFSSSANYPRATGKPMNGIRLKLSIYGCK